MNTPIKTKEMTVKSSSLLTNNDTDMDFQNHSKISSMTSVKVLTYIAIGTLGTTVIVEFKTRNSKEEYQSDMTISHYQIILGISRHASQIRDQLRLRTCQENPTEPIRVYALKFVYCQPVIAVLHDNKHSKDHDFYLDGTTIRKLLTDLTDSIDSIF